MFTVKFTRTFTRGTLKGLSIPQTLGGFPTAPSLSRHGTASRGARWPSSTRRAGRASRATGPASTPRRPVTASKGAEAAHVTGGFSDTGTASRFFPCFPADDPAAPFAYIPKPSRAEKNAGCEGLAQERHVVATGRMLNPVCTNTGARGQHCTCGACAFDGAAAPRAANAHPTVKPVALMRWLLRLITEPGDIVLDPFGGSGTTGVAALLEGRRVILVERDPAFAAICRARLSHAAPTAATLTARVAEPIEAPAADFGPLFGGAA